MENLDPTKEAIEFMRNPEFVKAIKYDGTNSDAVNHFVSSRGKHDINEYSNYITGKKQLFVSMNIYDRIELDEGDYLFFDKKGCLAKYPEGYFEYNFQKAIKK